MQQTNRGCGRRSPAIVAKFSFAIAERHTIKRTIPRQGAFLPSGDGPHSGLMHIHGSCAAREGAGVLLLGPPGSGKSDLVLRLVDRGFSLVADDRVEIADGCARPVPGLAGLIEIRGLGIVHLPYLPVARLALVAVLGAPAERLPAPGRHPELGLPSIQLDAGTPSAAARVALALDCALGRVNQHTGAFAA